MSDRVIRMRDRALNQMLHIKQFSESINENTTVEDIRVRLETLESRYQTVNDLENQLCEDPKYEPITNETDDIYYTAHALLTKAATTHGGVKDNQELNTTLGQFIDQQRTFYEGVNTSQHVRLPKIQIEQFSGDYKHWASFHDLYKTTVHDNHNITEVHKLQILKGLLSGEAAALIRHIPVTQNNYAEAWDKICSRYSKLIPIVSSLIQSFFDQKPCSQTNGKELRRVTEAADEIIRGLRAVGPDAEQRDPWLIHILLTKVDSESKQMWANESVGNNFPKFEKFLEFLNRRCDALEICDVTKKLTPRPTAKSFITNSNSSPQCLACNQNHPLFKCPVFKNDDIDARIKFVNKSNLCHNCLKVGHISSKCYSKFTCMICKRRHHTLLHSSQSQPEAQRKPAEISSHHAILNEPSYNKMEADTCSREVTITDNLTNKSSNVLHSTYSSPSTVLPTAIVYVETRTGQRQPIRTLLDSGSQTSFVTESCAQRLGLKRTPSSISIYGLASSSAGKTRGMIDMTIYSRVDNHYQIAVKAHIIVLQSSRFGWLVAGTYTSQRNEESTFSCHSITNTSNQPNDNLHQLLTKFWEVEEVGDHLSKNHTRSSCEQYFEETTTKDYTGRFIVRLPFKENCRHSLGSSFQAAHQRLLAMERKFIKCPEFCDEYKTFMAEYIALGHMTYVPPDDVPTNDAAKYYLPHHAVIKVSSSTTKLRVVFDGSCKTSTRLSLNDIVQVGPNIQTDLRTIILRFRKPFIAVVADVEKMYQQILMNSEDANFQLILWRENPNEQVRVYKLNTVTYGTACAPFLAIKALKQSTTNFEDLYPRATEVINNDFYIDDLLTGCNTVAEAVELKDQIISILGKSGFQLRKWKSNSPEFLESFSSEAIQNIPKLLDDTEEIKTLGVIWNSELDTFSFKVQQTSTTEWTKRKLLSVASKVYDPLGWLAPTIMLFKILLQKIWLLKIDWDSCLPDQITHPWQNIVQSLSELETIQLPRRLTRGSNAKHIQVHAFCDASEAAYGTVLYLRTTDENEKITTTLMYAKGKVAPLKQVSLPRLELCGALLLCKAVKFCIESLAYDNIQVFAWTDSMIVLHWLSDVPRRWKSFIGNRTATILEIIPRTNWYHVQSKHNPADAISRGIKPSILPKLDLWWHGPTWLSESEANWPTSKPNTPDNDELDLEERSKYVNVLTGTINPEDIVQQLLTKFSSWLKVQRIMVYILRFGCQGRHIKNINPTSTISPTEMKAAEVLILRNVQRTTFANELTILLKKEPLPTKHHLSSLDPFIDSTGLLRVGGRLKKSSLPYGTKHPVILPKKHVVCELIIRSIHTQHMHASNSLMLSITRNNYWIIGARYMIKHCIKSCTVCIRHRYHKSQQKMGDLPAERCTQSRPFLKVGLDYAGPLHIKTSKRKNAPADKAYVAVFVCLAVKAVHLEVVSGLDTASFLAALKRFISRRGIREQIWCDNGTNFIGADRELKELKNQITMQTNNQIITDFSLQKGIQFHFNPPRAPHFGGLWEASVKSFKYHLKRVTNANLTFEEMTTLINQIEALLNSRPLCRINDDPADLEILTPAHFLIGEALTVIPEPGLTDVPSNKLSKWQNIQQRLQGFWSRWHRDYLVSLQQLNKWKSNAEQFKIGDFVLLIEYNMYPIVNGFLSEQQVSMPE